MTGQNTLIEEYYSRLYMLCANDTYKGDHTLVVGLDHYVKQHSRAGEDLVNSSQAKAEFNMQHKANYQLWAVFFLEASVRISILQGVVCIKSITSIFYISYRLEAMNLCLLISNHRLTLLANNIELESSKMARFY